MRRRNKYQTSTPLSAINTIAVGALLLSACQPSTPIVYSQFSEVGLSAGLTHSQMADDAYYPDNNSYFTGGVAAADFDNDGYIDLYFTVYDGNDVLYRNRGDGTFEDVTAASGIARGEFSNGAAWGDIDNDGDRDLYVTTASNSPIANFLYINNGDGTFTEQGESRGAGVISMDGESAGFGDYDRDGWLDLYTTDWRHFSARPVLLRNQGLSQPGNFYDASAEAGITHPSNTFTPAFVDMNMDSWPDLMLAADFGNTRSFFNDGNGSFIDLTEDNGFVSAEFPMGTAIGDYDNDGDFDLFITSVYGDQYPATGNRFYQNNGDGTVNEISNQLGVRDGGWGWGTTFLDYDNDGDLDLVMTNGWVLADHLAPVVGDELVADIAAIFNQDRIRFWQNNAGQFVEVSQALNINDTLSGKGLIHLDYDNDGDLDFIVANNKGRPSLYRNDLNNTNPWLRINVEGSNSNRDGIGALIKVFYGDQTQIAQVSASGNFLGQNEKTVHFGFGVGLNTQTIDRIEVHWPSGYIQTLTNITANQTLLISEPNIVLDNDNDSVADQLDNCPYISNSDQSNNDNDRYGDACDDDDDNDGLADSVETNTGIWTSANDRGTNPFSADSDNDGLSDAQESNSMVFIEGGDIGTNPNQADTDGDGINDHDEVDFFHLNPLLPQSSLSFSIARFWNEELLDAIRTDYPAPTVHSRNLFHVSAAMWDAWAAYDNNADGYFFTEKHSAADIDLARHEAISYAAYRILKTRFANSPGADRVLAAFDLRMYNLGYDINNSNTIGNEPAAIGNRIAETILTFGLSDGSNELNLYADNSGYTPINERMIVKLPGTELIDKNRWQPLALDYSIAQNGVPLPNNTQVFLGSHWGNVTPFALNRASSNDVYNDPGMPPLLGGTPSEDAEFKEAILRVIRFSSLMTPIDSPLVDISPASIGNSTLGTNDGNGRAFNPKTAQAYQANWVKAGDYQRILAEFWADGPDSETPPGHWNTLANYVSDHSASSKKFEGLGSDLAPLEWDLKVYFALNGAMHDAAISAWDAKVKYDYIRPISAIRYMGGLGQSSDSNGPSYHVDGLPLEDGLVEVITLATTAPGQRHQYLLGHEGEIALYAWSGNPVDPDSFYGGVSWIRAIDWVPYQRDTFVTPPFAGYTSGHSTFSRAGAEILTAITGDEYFPDGMASFTAKAYDFLHFELGPSQDIQLQWATYYDAADEAGISRLSGGIHVDADDLKGRIMGAEAGLDAWAKAKTFYDGSAH